MECVNCGNKVHLNSHICPHCHLSTYLLQPAQWPNGGGGTCNLGESLPGLLGLLGVVALPFSLPLSGAAWGLGAMLVIGKAVGRAIANRPAKPKASQQEGWLPGALYCGEPYESIEARWKQKREERDRRAAQRREERRRRRQQGS
jgi:hypothetical protein